MCSEQIYGMSVSVLSPRKTCVEGTVCSEQIYGMSVSVLSPRKHVESQLAVNNGACIVVLGAGFFSWLTQLVCAASYSEESDTLNRANFARDKERWIDRQPYTVL